MCIVWILGSGERRLFIVVIVTCLKGLPCSFVETTSSLWHAQNIEQIRLALLQPNICVLQGISLRQEHLTSFSKSSGAKGCHWKELLEKEI